MLYYQSDLLPELYDEIFKVADPETKHSLSLTTSSMLQQSKNNRLWYELIFKEFDESEIRDLEYTDDLEYNDENNYRNIYYHLKYNDLFSLDDGYDSDTNYEPLYISLKNYTETAIIRTIYDIEFTLENIGDNRSEVKSFMRDVIQTNNLILYNIADSKVGNLLDRLNTRYSLETNMLFAYITNATKIRDYLNMENVRLPEKYKPKKYGESTIYFIQNGNFGNELKNRCPYLFGGLATDKSLEHLYKIYSHSHQLNTSKKFLADPHILLSFNGPIPAAKYTMSGQASIEFTNVYNMVKNENARIVFILNELYEIFDLLVDSDSFHKAYLLDIKQSDTVVQLTAYESVRSILLEEEYLADIVEFL
jgi:hypothetical protein